MPATIEKNITPPLTPLEIANTKIVSAKAASREEGLRRQRAWQIHRGSDASIPADASIHERTRLETEHRNAGLRLRAASQNYRPDSFVSGLLDVGSNREVLESALHHLREKHAAALKRKAAPVVVVPKARSGFVALIENALGGPVEPEPAFPPPRPPVRGGLWGQDEPLSIPHELERIDKAVASFPWDKSFGQVVGMMNGVDAAIKTLNPTSKPATATLPFFTWTVPRHM